MTALEVLPGHGAIENATGDSPARQAGRRQANGLYVTRIGVSITADELDRLTRWATADQVTLPHCIHNRTFAPGVRAVSLRAVHSEVRGLRYELNRIGNNLNQMAIELYRTGQIEPDDLHVVRDDFDRLAALADDVLPGARLR